MQDATSDFDRARAAAFLQELVGDDPIAPIPAHSTELAAERPSIVLQAIDEAGLAGALHIGRPYFEADENGGVLGRLLLEHTMMLHSIAVNSSRRRSGIGTLLLTAAEKRAKESGALIVFGVSSGHLDTDQFYRRHGYTVGPASGTILIRIGRNAIAFPFYGQDPSRWFFKVIATRPRPWTINKTPQPFVGAHFPSPDELRQRVQSGRSEPILD